MAYTVTVVEESPSGNTVADSFEIDTLEETRSVVTDAIARYGLVIVKRPSGVVEHYRNKALREQTWPAK